MRSSHYPGGNDWESTHDAELAAARLRAAEAEARVRQAAIGAGR